MIKKLKDNMFLEYKNSEDLLCNLDIVHSEKFEQLKGLFKESKINYNINKRLFEKLKHKNIKRKNYDFRNLYSKFTK